MTYREEQHLAINTAAGAAGFILYGLTLNEWVAVFTICYMGLQIGLLIPKYLDMLKKMRSRKKKK